MHEIRILNILSINFTNPFRSKLKVFAYYHTLLEYIVIVITRMKVEIGRYTRIFINIVSFDVILVNERPGYII